MAVQADTRANDFKARNQHVAQLSLAIRTTYDGLARSFGCRDQDDLHEARQRILLRLFKVAVARAHQTIDCPEAYAKNAARFELREMAREMSRTARPVGDDLDEHVERHALRNPASNPCVWEATLSHRTQVFRSYVAYYLEQARRGPSPLAAKHVEAWYRLRVLGMAADQVAELMGLAGRANAGRDATWQWAHRGAARVAAMADQDLDAERARVMRAAAGG